MIISVSNVFFISSELKESTKKTASHHEPNKKIGWNQPNNFMLCRSYNEEEKSDCSFYNAQWIVGQKIHKHTYFIWCISLVVWVQLRWSYHTSKVFSHDSVLLTSKQKKQETDKRKQIRRKRKRKASVHLSYDDFERSTIKRKDDVLITTTTFVCSYFSIFTLFPFFQFRVYVDDFNTGGSG